MAIGWTKIMSCTESSTNSIFTLYDSWTNISALGSTAFTVKFVPDGSILNPLYNNFAVIAKPGSNPVYALNNFKELSYLLNENDGTIAGFSDTDSWIGTNEARFRLNNSCFDGSVTGIGDDPHNMSTFVYQACDDQHGIHIIPSQNRCLWDFRTLLGQNISIYFGYNMVPTFQPTTMPITNLPTTSIPTATAPPTVEPTYTASPTVPTMEPTLDPTEIPTAQPTIQPTMEPTSEPTIFPTSANSHYVYLYDISNAITKTLRIYQHSKQLLLYDNNTALTQLVYHYGIIKQNIYVSMQTVMTNDTNSILCISNYSKSWPVTSTMNIGACVIQIEYNESLAELQIMVGNSWVLTQSSGNFVSNIEYEIIVGIYGNWINVYKDGNIVLNTYKNGFGIYSNFNGIYAVNSLYVSNFQFRTYDAIDIMYTNIANNLPVIADTVVKIRNTVYISFDIVFYDLVTKTSDIFIINDLFSISMNTDMSKYMLNINGAAAIDIEIPAFGVDEQFILEIRETSWAMYDTTDSSFDRVAFGEKTTTPIFNSDTMSKTDIIFGSMRHLQFGYVEISNVKITSYEALDNDEISQQFLLPEKHDYIQAKVVLFSSFADQNLLTGKRLILGLNDDAEFYWNVDADYVQGECAQYTWYYGLGQYTANCKRTIDVFMVHNSTTEPVSLNFYSSIQALQPWGVADVSITFGECDSVYSIIPITLIDYNDTKVFNNEHIPSLRKPYESFLLFNLQFELQALSSSTFAVTLIKTSQSAHRSDFIKLTFSVNEISIQTSTNFIKTISYVLENNGSGVTPFFVDAFVEYNSFAFGKYYTLDTNAILTETLSDLITLDDNEANKTGTSGVFDTLIISKLDANNGDVVKIDLLATQDPSICFYDEIKGTRSGKWRDDGIAFTWFNRVVNHSSVLDFYSKHIVEDLDDETLFHGPFVDEDVLTKYFTTAEIHDYIKVTVRMLGFGTWDVEKFDYFDYASIFLNFGEDLDDSYIYWAGTFTANSKCQSISGDDKWSNWTKYTQNDLPIDINFDSICYIDVSAFVNHNELYNPFTLTLTTELNNGVDADDSIHYITGNPPCLSNVDTLRTNVEMISPNYKVYWHDATCKLYLQHRTDGAFIETKLDSD
eukprot:451574_1